MADWGAGRYEATAAALGRRPAMRLVEVTRARLAGEGFDATVVVGEAQALPFADESFGVVLSVFAAIFAPSAEEAIGDILRMLRPGGRTFVCAWIPTGTIDAMMRAFGRAIAAATGSTSNPPFSWHDRDAVEGVAAGHGARVAAHDGEVAFVGDSPEAHFAAQEQSHPMALAMQALLESAGTYPALREEALAILRRGNESPESFRVTSAYRVLELRKTG
jgi:SAM-dependent methyltransferase